MYLNFATLLALLGWPVVAIYLYSTRSLAAATLWTILGEFLLLPPGAEIKFEGIPGFDKQSIPNLAAWIGCAVLTRRPPKLFYRFGLAEMLIVVLIISPFITSLLNTDPIHIGRTFLPGVGPYDALSASVGELIFILPFFLGRQYFRTAEDNAEILRALVIAGLAYSLLMLFEVRMSPQLAKWIYGYTYISLNTAYRDGSFRPVVFLPNGLWVAFFAMTALAAATALWRTQTRIFRWAPGAITGYLSFVLVLCKTGSALLYGILVVPLVRWASPRLQVRVASVLVIIALMYPMLRVADLAPTTSILEAVSAVSTERAASLNFRFVHEKALLERAWERPWFGWGRFGRGRVHDSSGADASVSDGYWIITMGTFGLIGFAARFSLLGLAVFRSVAAVSIAELMSEGVYLGALSLIVAANIFDQLPNASVSPWTWLLTGALLGRSERLSAARNKRARFHEPNTLVGQSIS